MGNDKQITEWSRLYGRPVSEAERQEIASNLDGFFTVLKEWDDKETRSNEVNLNVNVEDKNEQSDNHRG